MLVDKKNLSHNTQPQDFAAVLSGIKHKITSAGDKPDVTVAQQLDLLEQLTSFELGRFIIQNGGLNGFWTHYVLTYPMRDNPQAIDSQLTELEYFLLNKAPVILATQQRFQIFLQQCQLSVKEDAVLASLPCGMLGDLLYLDFNNIKNIELVGIDYDAAALADSKQLAEKMGLAKFVKLVQQDAWSMAVTDGYDLLVSNGLNIYEPDSERVTALYKNFYDSLRPGGRLVTSFITPPPGDGVDCTWDMQVINKKDLLLQRIIFSDVLSAKWQCYRSESETAAQLEAAGFKNYNFIYDVAKIFPTVVAEK